MKKKSMFYLIMEWILTVIVGIITLICARMLVVYVIFSAEQIFEGFLLGIIMTLPIAVVFFVLTLFFAIHFVLAIRDLYKYYKAKKAVDSNVDSSTYNLHNSVK